MKAKRALIWGAVAGLILGSVMLLLLVADRGGPGPSPWWLMIVLYLANWPVLKLFQHASNFSLLVMGTTILAYWVLLCVTLSLFCFLAVRKCRASLARIRAEAPGPNIAAAVVKHVARSALVPFGLFLAVVIVVMLWFQVHQVVQDRKNGVLLHGIVKDQDDRPLTGVELTFRTWNWRRYFPILFSGNRIVSENVIVVTGADGTFSKKAGLPGSEFLGASKPGYRADGPETDYMWRGFTGPYQEWTLHLFNEALIRKEQVRSFELVSVPFPADG